MAQLINPEEKSPIVIIGAGSIVNDAHLPAYDMSGFEVSGIFDLDKDKAAATAKKFGVPAVCDSLADLVALAQEKNCVYDMALPASAIISSALRHFTFARPWPKRNPRPWAQFCRL